MYFTCIINFNRSCLLGPPDITRIDFNEMPTTNVRDSSGCTVKDGMYVCM